MTSTPNATPSSPARPFPAVVSRPVLLGALLWSLSILYFVDQAVAIAASSRPYSLTTGLISDLGNTACRPDICSPLHAFVNATFIGVGLCHALGALLTDRAWPRVPLGRAGTVLLVTAGTGLVVAGLAPENVSPGPHAVGALIGLITLNLAMLAFGWTVHSVKPWLGRLIRAAGTIGLVGTAYFLIDVGPRGITERIADSPGAAMIVVLGAYLMAVSLHRVRGGTGGADS